MQALAGRTIRAILFDLGSTLWINEENATSFEQRRTSQQRVLALLRQHIPPRFFADADPITVGETIAKAVKQRTYEMYLLDTNVEPDFTVAVVDAVQQLGYPRIDRTVGAEIFETLRTRSFGSRMLFADALTTLAALQQRGFLLGVVTNRQYGGPLFLEDMRKFGLLDYFEVQHIAISADLGVRKPNPALFRYTLDALNIAPEEAVMVGDSLGADIVGAKQLAMAAAWKPNPSLFAQVRAAQQRGDTTGTFESMLFESARLYESKRGRPIPRELTPDLIIEHLSELLAVFVQAEK